MDHSTLASAVVLPELSPPASPTASKRRLSEISNTAHSPKRRRTSPEPDTAKSADNGTHDQSSPICDNGSSTTQRNSARRPSGPAPVDERKRSRRLFGALLGNIGRNRPRDTLASKRRVEQEERRQEEARKREAELEEKQKERFEQLLVARKRQQPKVDEFNMRMRHDNLRALACFLATETEPKLYYKPWELRQEDEERISRQKVEAERLIEQEVDEYEEAQREKQLETDKDRSIPANQNHIDGHSAEKLNPNHSNTLHNTSAKRDTPELAANTAIDESQIDKPPELVDELDATENVSPRKDSIDETGDVIVEGEEDTVIY